MKIIVILHLYYQDLWPEFSLYLKNITKPFDLCISLSNEFECNKIQETIKKEYPNVRFLILENRGADIYPFFEWMNILIEEKKEYDYLLKIHTKKTLRRNFNGIDHGTRWRKSCILPIVGSPEAVKNNIKLLSNPDIGMTGSKAEYHDASQKNFNFLKEGEEHMIKLANFYNIKSETRIFFGGTMFWCKYPILVKYLSRYKIPKEFFPLGNHAKGGTPAHAGERLFGRFFIEEGIKIVGV